MSSGCLMQLHVYMHIAQTVRISQGQSSLEKNYAHQAIGAFSECHGVYASLGLLHTMVSTCGVLCCNCK